MRLHDMRCWAIAEGAGSAPAATPEAAPEAAPASAPEPAPSSDYPLADLLNFDPFGPDPESPSPATTEGTAPAPSSTPSTEAPAPSPVSASATLPADGGVPGSQPAPTPAAPDPREQELTELRAQLAELRGFVEASRQPMPAVQPTAQPAAAVDQVPPYMFQIPQQLMQGLASEDIAERTTAVQHLLAGMARSVHRTLSQQMEERFRAVPEHVQTIVNGREAAREIFNDFYGAYPELRNPALMPVVQQISSTFERNGEKWSAKLRDKIAAEVYKTLGRPLPGQQAQAQQTQVPPTEAAPQRPPAMIQGSARPTVVHLPDDQQEMLDLIH